MANGDTATYQREIVIEPGRGVKNYWRDIWQYRELSLFLSWRDILVRYKQTVMGVAWAVVRPLFTMVILTVVFNKLAKFDSGDVPYPIMVYAAMLPWQLFASALSESSDSLISNTNLITKVYFPRLIIPASTILVNMVDFLISFLVLVLIMLWYQFIPGWRILTVPFFLFLAMFFSFGTGLWMSALSAKYRDFRYLIPFILQLGLYISPVGFKSDVVPEQWRLLYSFNPMVGVIDGFRWAILGGNQQIYWPGFISSIVFASVIFYFGLLYFRKTERTFADFI